MGINLGPGPLARASARHPWLTVGIWGAVLAAALFLTASLLGSSLNTAITPTNEPESTRADKIIEEALGKNTNLDEMIIIRSEALTVDDPAFRSRVESVFGSVMSLGQDVVLGGATYYMTGAESMVSADRHATFIPLTMPAGADKQVDKIYTASDSFATNGFQIYHTGDASFNEDTAALAENTMKTGETVGVAVALVVLAIVFGALAAALLPVALGVAAIIAALGLTAVVGQFMGLTFTVTNMITMMGLAVGIDYSLFILTRFREERHKGLSKLDAIAATGATASKAVLFSGITVILALAGLIVFPLTIFQTMGIGAILVVSTAILASLTLLPALLTIFGDKVDALRIPFVRRSSDDGGSPSGFWARTTGLVTRVPAASMVFSVALLAVAAVPYLDKETGMSGISGIPDDLPAKQGYMVLQRDFHIGLDSPTVIVIKGDITSEGTIDALRGLQDRLTASPSFAAVTVAPYPDKDLAIVYAAMTGDPMTIKSMDAVKTLRAEYIPNAFADTNDTVLVTGATAGVIDFNATTDTYTPFIFGFVLLLSFIVLTLAFRSIVIPATAILMNLFSVAASYGLIVLVFQKGIGNRLFGFQQVDVIESWLPLFLFALLFGLSMDYHVFLLSRIREHFKQTGNNSESVSFGLRSTGRLITGAALIMVAVFGGFALGDMVMFQQMGFGLAVAVLLDATVVRCVLVPATMKFLGNRNWYLPKWLEWIPDIGLGEHEPPQPVAANHVPQGRPVILGPSPVAVPVREMRYRTPPQRLSRNGF